MTCACLLLHRGGQVGARAKFMEKAPSISFGGPEVYDKEPQLPNGSRMYWIAYLAGPEAERQYWAVRREKENK